MHLCTNHLLKYSLPLAAFTEQGWNFCKHIYLRGTVQGPQAQTSAQGRACSEAGSSFDARPNCPGPLSIFKAGDISPLWATNAWQRFWQRHFNYHIIHPKAKGAKNIESSGTTFGVYTLKPGLVMGVSIQPGASWCARKQLSFSISEKPDFPTSYGLC